VKRWKIFVLVLGTATALLLTISLGLILLVGGIFEGMCANRIAAEYPSPDARHKAVVFERDCGATTGFSAQVTILGPDEVLRNEAGNVCVVEADGDTPDEINAEISVSWDGPDELVIRSLGVPKRLESRVDDVRVSYR
jgi:hypothetical protein